MDNKKLHELIGYIKEYALEIGRTPIKVEFLERYGNERAISLIRYNKLIDMAGLEHPPGSKYGKTENKPKILLLDIETAPVQAHIWRLYDENVGINQIIKDWHLLSYSAKWLGNKQVFYQDQRKIKNITDDKKLAVGLWDLINEADIIVGHNVQAFDLKKINARFIENGLKPPSHYRTIDTLLIARKKFGFTSNKLEFIAKKLCKLKKLTKRKFAGFELWDQCLKRNPKAWEEMEKYNKQDVLVLEELYKKLIAWDGKINFAPMFDGVNNCRCGASDLSQDGYILTNTGKYLRYICNDCGANYQDKKNLLKPKDMLKQL